MTDSSAKNKIYTSFEEFYPFYLSQHTNINNRRLHVIGTVIGCLILVYCAIFHTTKYLIYAPLISYGMAWVGHFVIEKNVPATFRYPLWSVRGDFTMVYESLTGKLKI